MVKFCSTNASTPIQTLLPKNRMPLSLVVNLQKEAFLRSKRRRKCVVCKFILKYWNMLQYNHLPVFLGGVSARMSPRNNNNTYTRNEKETVRTSLRNKRRRQHVCLLKSTFCIETCCDKTVWLYIWERFPHKGLNGCILKGKTKLAVKFACANAGILTRRAAVAVDVNSSHCLRGP